MSDKILFTEEELMEMENETGLEPAPNGEYELTCVAVSQDDNGKMIRSDKNGFPFFMLELEISGGEYKDVSKFVGLPDPERGKKNRNVVKNFVAVHKAFGLKLEPEFNPLKFAGHSCRANLTIEADAQYGDKNQIENFLIPK